MIDADQVELHDALLKKIDIDLEVNVVTITFEYYETPDDSKRKEISVVFEKVSSISKIADFEMLSKNAFAGNVSYWHPSSGSVPTYIYLTGGCIAIAAEKLRVLSPVGLAPMPEN